MPDWPATGFLTGKLGMNKPLTAPLDPALADRLLDLLSTDDLFRERFQRDPMTALGAIGYVSPDGAKMTACGLTAALEPFRECKVHELASKESILMARADIRTMLLRGLSQQTPKLDASLTREKLVLK